jgi:glycerol-1-phosphate dehydrogenase [NAD(P)+]
MDRLYGLCEREGLRQFLLISDRNTHAVLGDRVEKGLSSRGWNVRSVVFSDKEEVVADSHHVLKVLLGYDSVPRTFLAVGSGTITDITRFVSHRTGNAFVSLPTAPSVDGYTSTNVPLIVDGIKKSCTAHGPLAILADTTVLCSAPRPMIAAGFGDMLGKYTSVADWRLGHLLWDQPYDEQIARRALAAADSCAASAREIGGGTPAGVSQLMDALVESGFCMTDFGVSLPASGAEHHYSHFWEMRLLQEGRPALLHGAKVGVATILVAGLYDRIRGISRGDVHDLLQASPHPERGAQVRKIRDAFGPWADDVVNAQSPFLDMGAEKFDGLKRRILERWQDVQAIAAGVPAAARITELLALAGGPVTAPSLGLSDAEVALATRSAHYLRPHFTVRKLTEILFPGA